MADLIEILLQEVGRWSPVDPKSIPIAVLACGFTYYFAFYYKTNTFWQDVKENTFRILMFGIIFFVVLSLLSAALVQFAPLFFGENYNLSFVSPPFLQFLFFIMGLTTFTVYFGAIRDKANPIPERKYPTILKNLRTAYEIAILYTIISFIFVLTGTFSQFGLLSNSLINDKLFKAGAFSIIGVFLAALMFQSTKGKLGETLTQFFKNIQKWNKLKINYNRLRKKSTVVFRKETVLLIAVVLLTSTFFTWPWISVGSEIVRSRDIDILANDYSNEFTLKTLNETIVNNYSIRLWLTNRVFLPFNNKSSEEYWLIMNESRGENQKETCKFDGGYCQINTSAGQFSIQEAGVKTAFIKGWPFQELKVFHQYVNENSTPLGLVNNISYNGLKIQSRKIFYQNFSKIVFEISDNKSEMQGRIKIQYISNNGCDVYEAKEIVILPSGLERPDSVTINRINSNPIFVESFFNLNTYGKGINGRAEFYTNCTKTA